MSTNTNNGGAATNSSNASTSSQNQGRRNGQDRNQRGNNARGNQANQNANRSNDGSSKKEKKKLKGDIEDLGEHVFIINSYNQADKYTKTEEAIFKYINKNYTKGGDIVKAIKIGADADYDYLLEEWPEMPEEDNRGAPCKE